jgi:hypothetical protein
LKEKGGAKAILKSKTCVKPDFFQLNQYDKSEMNFYLMNINSRFYSKKNNKKEKFYFGFSIRELDGKFFEEVMVKGKGIFDFYLSRWMYDEIHYSFMLNRCNRAISQISNSCTWDLSYDLQYKDFFYFPKREELGINIFCKKSSEKSWTLLETYILKESSR